MHLLIFLKSANKLAIHFLRGQADYFEENIIAREFQERIDSTQSTLMAFFDYNSINKKSYRHLYQKFP